MFARDSSLTFPVCIKMSRIKNQTSQISQVHAHIKHIMYLPVSLTHRNIIKMALVTLFQLIVHPVHLKISGPSKLNGSSPSGTHFIKYSLVNTVLVKNSLGVK